MPIVITVVSAVSFLMLVFFISCYPLKNCTARYDKMELFPVVFVIPMFLFVPVGRLASFICLKYSVFVMALCCIIAIVLDKKMLCFAKIKLLGLTTLSFVLLVSLLKLALETGFPGEKYSLDLLRSVNVWHYLNFSGRLCVIISIISFVCAVFYCAQHCSSILADVYITLCIAIVFAVTLPVSIGISCCFNYAGVTMDFLFFWLVVVVLKKTVLKISAAAKY